MSEQSIREYDRLREEADAERNPAIKAPEGVLCYDPVTSTLNGDPDSPLDGLTVRLAEVFESTATARVVHGRLPAGEIIVALCSGDTSPDRETAPQAPDPLTGCCVDERTGTISCPGGEQQWYMHGRQVPLSTMACSDTELGRRCVIHMGDGSVELAVCPPPPGVDTPPQCCVDTTHMVLVCEDPSYVLNGAQVVEIMDEQPDGLLSVSFVVGGVTRNGRFYPCQQPPTQRCCYDIAAGVLRCEGEGELSDQSVSLVSMQAQADGSVLAVVQIDGTSATATFPICDDQVSECCYDPTTETLVCPGTELDGQPAGIVAAWTGPDGEIYVWAAWNGGAARMPLCPGTTDCPPVFCCVNMQTLMFVCPGRPELNGSAAPIAEIITEDGYTWATLDDGTRVPMCGQRCPPPRLCPECPSCPPGEWRSPDGTCTEPPHCPPVGQPCPPGHWTDPQGRCVDPPTCPQCPEGWLLNTRTGECVQCPGSPPPGMPPKKPCCESCADGGPCEGESGNHQQRQRQAGPRRNPRKRRIFAGNR